jgi:hypothetical protein
MHEISQVVLYERLLPMIESSAVTGSPTDIHELNFATAMDFITAYQFGLGNSSNFLRDTSFRGDFLDAYLSRRTYTFWPQEAPGVMKFLKRLGVNVVPEFVDEANRKIETWCLSMCKGAANASNSAKNPQSLGNSAVVCTQLARSLKLTDAQTSKSGAEVQPVDLIIASEMLDQLAAGFETSGITLTYLMHELSKRPDLQAALRDELLPLYSELQLNSPTANLPSPRALDALPLLQAIFMETLRLHAAIPGPQPRITPPTPSTLAGYAGIPPGTRVSALPYALHRNEAVFPDALVWEPERWIKAGKEQKEDMGRWFWAFGSGGRMCIGSNFAMQGM